MPANPTDARNSADAGRRRRSFRDNSHIVTHSPISLLHTPNIRPHLTMCDTTSTDILTPVHPTPAARIAARPRVVPAALRRTCGLLLLCFIPAIMPLWAQASENKSEPAPAPKPEEAIELSPFVVSVNQDTGYVAQDTLSGTRTRTLLKDVAGAIGVFTADLISDLGATAGSH